MTKELVSVKYIGRHFAVELDPDGLGDISVVFGETIQVPKDVAYEMLKQTSNWEFVKPVSPVTPSKSTPEGSN